MKKVFRSVAFWHITIGAIIVIVCWACGLRITYSPDIDYNWEAISAVASWVGAAIVPFAVLWLQHKWDNNKQDIADSNSATVEEIRRRQEEIELIIKTLLGTAEDTLVIDGGNASSSTNLTTQDKIQQYISIAMAPTTQEISTYLKIPTEKLLPTLKEMKERKIIWTKYIRDDISSPDCRWKLLKK